MKDIMQPTKWSGEKTKVKVEYENSDAKGSPGACGMWSGMCSDYLVISSHHLVYDWLVVSKIANRSSSKE